MKSTFSVSDYLQHLALEVIRNFDFAGKATTPGLVGGSRETEIRSKIELLLPKRVGVGTGCIIDSYENTSKQTDVILYEKDICPVFSINKAPESTYYPCESVIAIGEVKSVLDTRDLTDSFTKIESVKSLQRYTADTIHWRSYGTTTSVIGTESQRYDPKKNDRDNVYGFILCERIGLKLDTFLDLIVALSNQRERHLLPDLIISLTDGVFQYVNAKSNSLLDSAINADGILYSKLNGKEFQYLLNKLNYAATSGRSTSELPFTRYIDSPTSLKPDGIKKLNDF